MHKSNKIKLKTQAGIKLGLMELTILKGTRLVLLVCTAYIVLEWNQNITHFTMNRVGIYHRWVNTGIYQDIKTWSKGWYESELQENQTDAV